MYIRDHGVAHFHARHGGDEAVVEVATGEVLAGGLDRRQMKRCSFWAFPSTYEVDEPAQNGGGRSLHTA